MNSTTAPAADRVPLTRLTERRSPLLARIVPADREDGPEPVTMAAFQSSV